MRRICLSRQLPSWVIADVWAKIMKTYRSRRWIGRAGGLSIVTLLAGCHSLSPGRKHEPDKEWATRTKDSASELAKYTGGDHQIDWNSLPNTPPK
jgi:hypothetical protein